MNKKELVSEIGGLLEKCKDQKLLLYIYMLLVKSC